MAYEVPEFQANGYLPDGDTMPWTEFAERFAWNTHRQHLLELLLNGLLVVRRAGCVTAWVNGSFTTAKDFPGDVDVLYSARTIRLIDLPDDFKDRKQRKITYGGDYLAVDDEDRRTDEPTGLFRLFRADETGIPKGNVQIPLGTLPRSNQS